LRDGFDDSTSLDDFEHYRKRLQETLDRLISLYDAIHDLLSDEYEDIKAREEYIDRNKRANRKANRRMDNSLSASTAQLRIHGFAQPTSTVSTDSATPSLKLPAIEFKPFAGNVEN